MWKKQSQIYDLQKGKPTFIYCNGNYWSVLFCLVYIVSAIYWLIIYGNQKRNNYLCFLSLIFKFYITIVVIKLWLIWHIELSLLTVLCFLVSNHRIYWTDVLLLQGSHEDVVVNVWTTSKRVRSPVKLSSSLLDKNPLEKICGPPYSSSYGLNSSTTVLLQRLALNNSWRLLYHKIEKLTKPVLLRWSDRTSCFQPGLIVDLISLNCWC